MSKIEFVLGQILRKYGYSTYPLEEKKFKGLANFRDSQMRSLVF